MAAIRAAAGDERGAGLGAGGAGRRGLQRRLDVTLPSVHLRGGQVHQIRRTPTGPDKGMRCVPAHGYRLTEGRRRGGAL